MTEFDTLLPYRSTLASKLQLPPLLPTCPEPYLVTVQKNTFQNFAFPFVIFDFGNRMVASFGYQEYLLGPNFLDTNPFNGVSDAMIRLGSSQKGFVVDATISYLPDTRTISNKLISEMINSYGRTFDALLGGDITIHGYPFPTTTCIGTTLAVGGGEGALITGVPKHLAPSMAKVGVTRGAAYSSGTGELSAYLPGPGNFKISMEITRDLSAFAPYKTKTTPSRSYYYLWGGFLTITLNIKKRLGMLDPNQNTNSQPPSGST